jgi:hypothetical protein
LPVSCILQTGRHEFKTKVLHWRRTKGRPLNDGLALRLLQHLRSLQQVKPYERVMVVSTSVRKPCAPRIAWYTAPHDEFAIVMDGEISSFLLTEAEKPAQKAGASRLKADPQGKRMGRVIARRGHEVLLPRARPTR